MSDRIKFRCDCGKKLNAPTVSAGKRCKCTGCGRMMRIPLPAPPRGAPPQIGIRAPGAPAAPTGPVPEAFDFELELGDLGEIQPSAPTRPTATKPPPPPTALASSSQADPIPQGIPIPAPAAGKSIWDEEADYDLAAPPQDAACPKCGTAMQPSARVCLACGYNRETGIQTMGAPLAPVVSKKKKRSSSIGFGGLRGIANAFLSRWVLIPLVIGITFLGIGFKEQKLADISSAEPEPISLARLLERGPNGNPNLSLSDFELCENWVYEKKTMVGVAVGEWTKVWVPIVPTSDANRAGAGFANLQNAQNIRTLILSSRVHNENEVVPTLAVKQLNGMVINQIASLNSKEKKFLEQGYPGVNFDNVIIFEENRQPASSERIGYLLAGGGLLVVVGIGIAVKQILST